MRNPVSTGRPTLQYGVGTAEPETEAESHASPPADHTSLSFLRNILTSWLGRVAMLAMSFIATGAIVHQLGKEQYGLWAIVFTLTSYLAFVDVGVNGGLVRAISTANARQEYTRLSSYVMTALAFYSVVGLALIGAVALLRVWLAEALGVPDHLLGIASWLLIGVTVVFVLNNLMFVFTGVVTALEDLHVAAAINVVASLLTTGGVIAAVLIVQADIGVLLAVSIAAAALGLLMAAVWVRRRYDQLRLSPRSIAWSALRAIATLSLGIQISNMAGVVNFTVDKFVVARIIGLSAAGLYDLGSRLTVIIWMLTWMVAGAAYPVASRLSEESPELIRPFYIRAELYLIVTTCALAGGLVVTAPWLIHAWLGPGYSRAILVTQVLAVASAGLALTNVAKVTLWGMNRVREATVFEVWRLVMHVILSVLLTWKFGFNGALVGALASLTLPSAWLLWIAHRRIGVDNRIWLQETFARPLAAVLLATGVSWITINMLMAHALQGDSRLRSLVLLAASGLVFGLTFLFGIFRLHVFPPEEIETLRHGRAALWLRMRSLTGASS